MLYDDLVTLFPSPIHELNRAIVVAQISGPHAGIAAVESIRELDALEDYHLLHATRANYITAPEESNKHGNASGRL
jgi:predicted RNA polymerase sigma factor